MFKTNGFYGRRDVTELEHAAALIDCACADVLRMRSSCHMTDVTASHLAHVERQDDSDHKLATTFKLINLTEFFPFKRMRLVCLSF